MFALRGLHDERSFSVFRAPLFVKSASRKPGSPWIHRDDADSGPKPSGYPERSGRDCAGEDRSGKTAAFGLGILNAIDTADRSVQALVLCPTRELADQVTHEIRRLARALPNTKLVTLCGGKPFGPQRVSLKHGVHIVIGTPGRILDHLERGSLNLHRMKILVLDEADRMLDMGFEEAVSAIIKKASGRKQTCCSRQHSRLRYRR